jgi:hypothetical protein
MKLAHRTGFQHGTDLKTRANPSRFPTATPERTGFNSFFPGPLRNQKSINQNEEAEMLATAQDRAGEISRAFEKASKVCHDMNNALQIATGLGALVQIRTARDIKLKNYTDQIQYQIGRLTDYNRKLNLIFSTFYQNRGRLETVPNHEKHPDELF